MARSPNGRAGHICFLRRTGRFRRRAERLELRPRRLQGLLVVRRPRGTGMARGNSNRSNSRPATGGLRNTQSVRLVSRSIARQVAGPLDAIGGRFFSPDMSAFTDGPVHGEITDGRASAIRSDPARKAAPGRVLAAKAANHSLRPIATAVTVAPAPAHRAPTKASKPLTKQGARPLVTQSKTSIPSRVERSHPTCKERPERPQRGKSGGASKVTFVPWCGRKS